MIPDPSTQEFLERTAASGFPPLSSLAAADARRMNDPLSAACEHPPVELAEVEDICMITGDVPELRARCYRPVQAATASPALLFFHGGGGVVGNLDTHDSVCRTLARDSGCVVVAVDYRLGPEQAFPAGLEDAWAALSWVFRNSGVIGLDPKRIAVGGDSAGGGLAAAVAQRARYSSGPQPRFQLLIYPALDANREQAAYPSWRENANGYFLDHDMCRWFLKNLVQAGQDLCDPELSPLRAGDFSGLPDTLIVTAGFDPLRDEGAAYAEVLRLAGVKVDYRCYESTIHGFISMGRFIPLALEALDLCASGLRAALKPVGTNP